LSLKLAAVTCDVAAGGTLTRWRLIPLLIRD
jgi:hypothetical protein